MYNNINYDPVTGRIICVSYENPLDTPLSNQLRVNNVATNIADDYYVNNYVLALRPDMPVTFDSATNTFSNVPVGALIFIKDQSFFAEDSTVTIEFPYPGDYPIFIGHFPYKDYTTTVTI